MPIPPVHPADDDRRRSHRDGRSRKVPTFRNQAMAIQVGEALRRLEAEGVLTGQAEKISARIDHGLLAAAARKAGTDNVTDVVAAALATFAAPDPFVAWFLSDEDRLPADFELAI